MVHSALEKNIFRHKTIKAIVYRSLCEMSQKHKEGFWCRNDACVQDSLMMPLASFQTIRADSVLFVSPLTNILGSRVVVKETKSFDSSFSDRCQKFTSIYFA